MSIAVTSKAKQLGTWRVSDYTPEYRETSGVGKRKLLTMDEVLRLPINKALVIIRGRKVLQVDKFDYTSHPEASKLTTCKASEHIPEWSKNPRPEKTKTTEKKNKQKSSAKAGVVKTTKDAIMSD